MEVKKVVVLGPESTGKSELSEFLAAEFNTVWVKEYARTYLANLNAPYGPSDLLNIATGQLALENELVRQANKVLICDTDLHVIKVWSRFKYGFCDPLILDLIANRRYDLYLLTYIDVPWVADPQREHPDQRDVLYEMYLNEMRNQSVPFTVIEGSREERRKRAVDSIRDLLDGRSGQ